MAESITKYSESFKIRADEVDSRGKATIPSLCGLFQEVAGNHALKLNFDITQLHEQNLTWVLHRMNIKMNRYPDWRETITIETWPAAGDALRAYRNYRILAEDHKNIGVCLSYWMMINLKTRRPTRMPKEVLELRLDNIDHVLDIKSDKIPPVQNLDMEKKFRIRHSDLDMNNHVNNTHYLELMTEVLPEKRQHTVSEVDIIFAKESVYEEELRSRAEFVNEVTSRHQLINQNNDTVALAVFSFD